LLPRVTEQKAGVPLICEDAGHVVTDVTDGRIARFGRPGDPELKRPWPGWVTRRGAQDQFRLADHGTASACLRAARASTHSRNSRSFKCSCHWRSDTCPER